jgi:transposase
MQEIEYKKEILGLRSEVSELKSLVNNVLADNEKLREENYQLRKENQELKVEIESLKSHLSLNSQTSSKPPSSDNFVKKTKSLREKSNKKVGGQKGHNGNTLKMVPNPDKIEIHHLKVCNYCNNELSDTQILKIKKRQVFEIPKICLEVTEHQAEVKICSCCKKINHAEFPPTVSAPVQYGNRLKSFGLYLNNYQLLPYDRISELLEQLLGMKFNVGSLFSANKELYEKLETTEVIIREKILKEKILNVDETGFYVKDSRQWLHLYSTDKLTYYHHHKKRGKEAMNEIGILPNFKGRIIHDFWQSYFNFDCQHSLCNAHHLRELNFVIEQEQAIWAKEMKVLLLEIKSSVDKAKKNSLNSLSTHQLLDYEKKYEVILEKALQFYPDIKTITKKRGRKKQDKGKNLLDRLINYREETLSFMYNFEIPFDNNQAERDVRMMKLKQKISGCFRTEFGSEIFCRIRGFISSIKKQQLNILEQIYLALNQTNFLPEFLYAK